MKKSFLPAFLLFLFLGAADLSAKNFYVSPTGNDSGDGSASAPFATLEKARDAVRAFRKAVPDEAVTVELAGGLYVLEAPLVFEPEDSGSPEAPVTWRGKAGERAVISGGRVLSGWRSEGNGLFSAPCVTEDSEAGTQLFVEKKLTNAEGAGTFLTLSAQTLKDAEAEPLRTANFPDVTVDVRRAIRARAPNWNPEDAAASFFWARKPFLKGNSCQKYRLAKGDLDPYIFDEDGKILPEVQIVTYQYWSSSFNRAASYSPETGILEFPRPCGRYYPTRNARWHVENSRAALDAAGEWYFDRRAGRVFYLPLADEDLTRDSVVLTVCPRWLIETKGDWMNDRYVQYLTFENLVFSYADADLSPDYEHSVQAAHTQRGAFQAVGMAHCRIQNCEFSHLGENGITLLEGSHENLIFQNHIFDVGAAGVAFPSVPQGEPDERAVIRKNTILNNLIHHTGALFHSSCGIFFAGMAQFNTVKHNDVSNTTWAGMQYGWSWGSGKAYSNHNEVGWNHIHHISRGIMNDLAGIYTLGDTDGSRLHHNWIHDVDRFTRGTTGYGGWGLYTDAGTSNLTMDCNLVHDTQDPGIFIHNYAHPYHTVVRNNISACCDSPGFSRSATMFTDKDFGVAFERNINFSEFPEMLHGGAFVLRHDPSLRMSKNCYWTTSGEEPVFQGKSFEEWREITGVDAGSLIADPKFVNPEKRDFRLAPDSPVLALGFVPFDLCGDPNVPESRLTEKPETRAGIYGPAAWTRLALQIVHRPLLIYKNSQANLPYSANFDELEIDEDLPDGFTYYKSTPKDQASEDSSRKDEAVHVSEEAANSGKRALKVTDSPEHKNSYDPHVVIQGPFPYGEIAVKFAIRPSADTHLQSELRQYSKARSYYEQGPVFQILPQGKVYFSNSQLMEIPVDEWTCFTLRFRSESPVQAKKKVKEPADQSSETAPQKETAETPAQEPGAETAESSTAETASKTWTLEIQPKNGPARTFGPYQLDKHFKTLEWMGFLSFAPKESAYFLDDVNVSQVKE